MLAAVIAMLLQAQPGATAPPANLIRFPIWERAPDRPEILKAFPEAARKAGTSGMAMMLWRAGEDARLHGCTVSDESPLGAGFGAALLSLREQYKLAPIDLSKQPVAGRPVRVGR